MFFTLPKDTNSIKWLPTVEVIAGCHICFYVSLIWCLYVPFTATAVNMKCLWYDVCMCHLQLQQLIWKVYIIIVFEKHIYVFMYCTNSVLKDDICHNNIIDICHDDIYVIWYTCVQMICTYVVQKNFCVVYVFCYVGQYQGKSFQISLSSVSCLGGNFTAFIVCTAIHNCSSSGSLFFASLRQNN